MRLFLTQFPRFLHQQRPLFYNQCQMLGIPAEHRLRRAFRIGHLRIDPIDEQELDYGFSAGNLLSLVFGLHSRRTVFENRRFECFSWFGHEHDRQPYALGSVSRVSSPPPGASRVLMESAPSILGARFDYALLLNLIHHACK
jgi:hypothetical protein